MLLTPSYDGPPVIAIDGSADDVLVPFLRQRRRLGELLSGFTEDQWAAPSRCEGWSVQDVVAHLDVVNGFWALSIGAGLAGAPTRYLAGVRSRRLARRVRTGDALPVLRPRPSSGCSPPTRPWPTCSSRSTPTAGPRTAEAPPGHLPIRLVAYHGLWDAWVHERDILLPLGLTPAEEPDEIYACLRYVAALGPAFSLSRDAGRTGALVLDCPDVGPPVVVEVDGTVARPLGRRSRGRGPPAGRRRAHRRGPEPPRRAADLRCARHPPLAPRRARHHLRHRGVVGSSTRSARGCQLGRPDGWATPGHRGRWVQMNNGHSVGAFGWALRLIDPSAPQDGSVGSRCAVHDLPRRSLDQSPLRPARVATAVRSRARAQRHVPDGGPVGPRRCCPPVVVVLVDDPHDRRSRADHHHDRSAGPDHDHHGGADDHHHRSGADHHHDGPGPRPPRPPSSGQPDELRGHGDRQGQRRHVAVHLRRRVQRHVARTPRTGSRR